MSLLDRCAVRRSHVVVAVLLGLLAAASPVTPAAAAPSDPSAAATGSSPDGPWSAGPAKAHRPDRVVLVVTGSSTSVAAARKDARAEAATTRLELPALRSVSFVVPAGRAEALRRRLAKRSGLRVEQARRLHLADVPNDPGYGSQQAYLDHVNASAAWDVTHGSAGVKIAVIDSGVRVNHPDLAGKVAGAYNAVTGTSDVTDRVGHGTMVAGIAAAATGNGTGIAGTGWSSRLLAVKVADQFNEIYSDAVAAGILWAGNHGARVINISLGAAQSSPIETDAIAKAQAKGALVVAAAGNESTNAPSYPSAVPGVLAVGATDAFKARSSFSNYGSSWVDLAAPGEGIISTSANGSYASGAGTSFSSPLVAGAAALLAGRAPKATATQLAAALTDSGQPLAGQDLGAGLLDMSGALAKLIPGSTPAITSPAPDSVVSGVQPVTVSSSAPTVQLSVDGKDVGAPVAPSGPLSIDTWGLSNGPHVVGAADCNSITCGTRTTVSVAVQNAAPVLSPLAGGVARGAQVLTASSDAPLVRFTFAGSAPVHVATSGGTASTTWRTWGLRNSTHTVTVAACAAPNACGAAAGTSVPVANTVPAISQPNSGGVVGGATTFTASAPGGGLRFVVDNVVRGFDATAPYSLPFNASTLANGAHTLKVVGCNSTGTSCAGPSVVRGFTSRSLRPLVVSAVSPFSPNGDKRRDTTTWVLRLPDTERVSWRIVNSAGTTVAGPTAAKSYGRGDHRFTWGGRNGRLPNGLYTIRVSTTGAGGVRGLATRTVRLDATPPSLSAVVGSGGSVYPAVDGFRDTVRLGVSVNESATVTLRVKNSAGSVVRTLSRSRSGSGPVAFSWNGRTASGSAVRAGAYTFSFTARDAGLSHRSTGAYRLAVSAKRLVARTATLTKHGTGFYDARVNDPYCSGFLVNEVARAIWMINKMDDCDPPDGAVVAALYEFALPGAISYTSLTLQAYGRSDSAPSNVSGALKSVSSGEYGGVRRTPFDGNLAWRTVSVAPGLGYVSRGVVRSLVKVVNDVSVEDIQLYQVRLVVSYKVLA